MGNAVAMCVNAFSKGHILLSSVVFEISDFKADQIAFRIDITH